MYWPLGAPRVYAAAKRRRKGSNRNENDGGEGGDEDEKEVNDSDSNSSALIGLCVARNGRLFATITNTSLTIWQTSVGDK